MDQTAGLRNKLSTINEMTESTGIPQSLNESSETSINGMELDVNRRITERSTIIRQKMIADMIAPKFKKTIDKICKKLKIQDDGAKSGLHAIVQEVQQECHRLLQQRVDDIANKTTEFQSMLNEIVNMSVELTDRTTMAEVHLPIRKGALEKLTVLSNTVSDTVKNNTDRFRDLEQELKDREHGSNSKRRKLFKVCSQVTSKNHTNLVSLILICRNWTT